MQNNTMLVDNDSLNLTVNVIAENLTGTLVSETPTWSYIFPIITLIIGALLSFGLTSYGENKKEKKEIRRYEYTVITDILSISKKPNKIEQMSNYYDEEKRNPRFVKIEHYKVVLQFMRDVMDNKAVDENVLKNIKKGLKT